MTKPLLVTVIAILLILGLEWKNIRTASSSTKWITFIMLGISGVIWVYITTVVHVSRPTVWLERIMEPFSLIKQ
jgi:hypothetical protein